jgi:hypothetical protein
MSRTLAHKTNPRRRLVPLVRGVARRSRVFGQDLPGPAFRLLISISAIGDADVRQPLGDKGVITDLSRGAGHRHARAGLGQGRAGLGHRTSSTDVARALLFGVWRSRTSTVAALLNPFRGLVLASEGDFIYQLNKIKSLENEFFRYFVWKGDIVPGAHAFRNGGAPKAPYMRHQARTWALVD